MVRAWCREGGYEYVQFMIMSAAMSSYKFEVQFSA